MTDLLNVAAGPEGEAGPAATLDLAASAPDRAVDVASTTRPLCFTVLGVPIPQGSHKAYVVNGYAKVTDDNAKTKPWRQDVKAAAVEALTLAGAALLAGPVQVQVRFVMPRPKGHYRTGKNAHLLRDSAPAYPDVKPDVDKLQRSLLDALTAAGVFRDDAQVVRIAAEKTYVDHRLAQIPCAHVQVEAAT